MTVTRHEIGVNSVETMLDEQLDLTARFRTAFLHHTLIAGVEGAKETSGPTRPTWSNIPTTSLLNPNAAQPFSGTEAITSTVHTTGLTAATYMLDTIELSHHWDLTGGIRFDRFDTAYTQQVGAGFGIQSRRPDAQLARRSGL